LAMLRTSLNLASAMRRSLTGALQPSLSPAP